ncbi:polyprenyl synthetase family protein [Streptomyces thinghirensis]|nr:polyprenyl synthetase family protein [Streptomyces thinghirensis]
MPPALATGRHSAVSCATTNWTCLGDAAAMGKPTGTDIREGRRSYTVARLPSSAAAPSAPSSREARA